jgi:hypothetical protein
MKARLFFLIFASVSIFTVASPEVARAQSSVSFEFFYDSLDPYGEWVEVPEYGYCWHPWNVDEDWAPYTDGYWAYTDAGWTWVSYEDWGAITYHYGRWVRIAGYGWSWVPDYDWGPAWVSWRTGDDYVGWAPLPPEARFVRGTGFSVWVDLTYGIGPAYYNFCSYRDFGAPVLRPLIIDRRRNVTIINNTVNITNITVNQTRNVIFNGGLDPRLVERRGSRPIPTLNLVRQTDLGAARAAAGGFYSRHQGNQLFVVAPQVERSERKIKPANVARMLPAARVDKGWNTVPQSQVTEMQTRMRREIKDVTPENAPAKPVTRDELKIVQERIKATSAGTPVPAPAQVPTAPFVTQGVVPATTPIEDKTRGRGRPGKGNITAAPTVLPTAPVPKEIITAAPTPVAEQRRGEKKITESVTPAPQLIQPTPPAIDETTTSGRGKRFLKVPPQQPTPTQPAQILKQVVQPTPNPELEQRQRQQEALQQQKKLEAEQQQLERQRQQEALQQKRQMEAEQARQRAQQQQNLEADQQAKERVRQQEQQQIERQRQQEALQGQQQRQMEAEQARQRAQQQQIERQRQIEAVREQQKQQVEQSRHRVEQPQQPPPQQVQPKQQQQVAPGRKLTKEEEEQLKKQQQQ